jgi:preprotein translocase subunit SecA
MYDKLSGMTGTADTEAAEFKKIYNLDVIGDSHEQAHDPQRLSRRDLQNAQGEVQCGHRGDQSAAPPWAAGSGGYGLHRYFRTAGKKLKKQGRPHEVLNAKNHEKEAEIISMAGQKGGRDHLHQHGRSWNGHRLRGRGDRTGRASHSWAPSGMRAAVSTTSLEAVPADRETRDLPGFIWRWKTTCCGFSAVKRITGIMERLGLEEGEPIEHNLISRAIENAQTKVEAHNFDIRKHLLEYDDVMNQQREVIYKQRRDLLTGVDL